MVFWYIIVLFRHFSLEIIKKILFLKYKMSRYAFLYFLIGLAILIFFFFLLTLYNDVRRDLFYKEKNKNCTYKNLIDKRTKEVRLWRIIYYCFLPTNAKMYYNCFFYFFFFLIQFATLVYFFYSIDCV